MPRKLYRNIEDMSLPEERPGSGRSRLAETKKNLAAGRAEAASLKALSPKEREAMRLRMQSDEIAEAGAHELEPFFEKATEEFDVAEQRFQIDPSDENEAAMEVAREKAGKLNVQINELLPEGRSRRKPSKMLAREAFVAKHEERGVLLAEQASLKDRMQEMGGVWGGESYFILNDRLEEIERAVRKMETGSEKRQKEKPVEVEKLAFASEPTAQDRLADAHKTIKQMKRYEREIEARKQKVVDELKRHGISNAQLPAELARLTPELREATTGVRPGFLERIKTGFLGTFVGVAHGLAGIERPRQAPEVRALLEKYVEIETEKNVEFHKRADAQHELEAAEVAAGKARVSGAGYIPDALAGSGSALEMSGFLETATGLPAAVEGNIHLGQELEALQHIEQGSVQQELAAVRALKMIEEEIQDDMMNFARRKEDGALFEDVGLYREKLDSLKQRLNALDESAGDSEAAKKAAHEAREAYVQYRRQVSQGASAIVGQAQTAGKGEPRPPSTIGQLTKPGGQFTAAESRTTVQLSKMETADKKEREKAEARERVNRDVKMYRSFPWRKDLIDGVNADESVRPAMHAVYEAYKKRVQEMMAKGELNLITGSPDPALDYTLDLYRLYARKEGGKHAFNEKIVSDASAGVIRVNELLGGMWDEDGATDHLVRALLREKPTLTVAENDTEEVELDESGFEEIDPELARDLEKLRAIENKMVSVKLTRIEIGPTLSVDELKVQLDTSDNATRAKAKRIVGLVGRTIKTKNIADQYGVLVKMAKSGDAPSAERIKKLHDLLGIKFEVVPVSAPSVIESVEPIPLTRVKRFRSDEEEVKSELEEIPSIVEVPPVMVEPVIENVKPKLEVVSNEERERMDSEAQAAFEASLTEVRPEQYEAMRTASDALDNEFRKVFSLAKNVVPETFIEGKGKGAWMDAAAGKRMRQRIGVFGNLVKALPIGDDFRVPGLSKVEIFSEFVNKALRKRVEMNKTTETPPSPEVVAIQKVNRQGEKGAKRRAKEAAKRERQAAVMTEGGATIVDLGARRKEDRNARRASIEEKQTGGKSEESA